MDAPGAKRLAITVKMTLGQRMEYTPNLLLGSVKRQLFVSRDRSLRRFSSIFILMLGCTLGTAPTTPAFDLNVPWHRNELPGDAAIVEVMGAKVAAQDTPFLLPMTLSLRSFLPADKVQQRWIWLMAGVGGVMLVGTLLYHWNKGARARDSTIIDRTSSQLPENRDEAIDSAVLTEPTQPDSADSSEDSPEVQNPTPLRRIGIVETLIQDLHSRDPVKRRQAIWELGQLGDSRAIQPLVDLTLDSDSAQRSLILAALSEIGVRTLKPMNRALAVSLQDESPEVRKNAIRDLTRVYDLMAQIAQLLNHASEDGDREVSETARWALGKLDRIRTLAGRDFSALPASEPPSELPEEKTEGKR
ncbi:MAG: HEAT repeat domain-containing protein [Geitlerinemataceae cyanobacterium]